MANYNPEKATPREHWTFRMEELKRELGTVPLTSTQRIILDHHLHELERVFDNMRFAVEDAGIQIPPFKL